MNQKSSIMILGSGLMVLTLATLVGLFLFSPASKSARAGSSTESSSYPDIATLTQESTEQPAQDSTTTTTTTTTTTPPTSSSALVPSRNYRFGQGAATTMTPTTPTDSGVSISRASGQQASGQQGQAVQTNQNPLLPSQQSPGSHQAWSQNSATSQTAKDIKTNNQVATAPAQKTTTTTVAKKPATIQTAPKKTTAPTQKNTSAAAKPAPKQLASTTYWIQLASYSSLSRAKGTQEDLKKLGLSTNIEVSDIGNGRLVYRLKAGAWTSEKEALNFLDQFKTSHPRFADAFVVNNRGKR